MSQNLDILPTNKKLAKAYKEAKAAVINAGYIEEIKWQESVSIEEITESNFLKETAWVILSSGMRESIVRNIFPFITKAFFNWESSYNICINSDYCRKRAVTHFNNPKKIDAIISVAQKIREKGFHTVIEDIKQYGIDYIMEFPYMGQVTSYHLAKNIGLPVVKPDRHLTRIAKVTGYTSPFDMCMEISKIIGDNISVIDIVIWRYATLYRDYINHFTP